MDIKIDKQYNISSSKFKMLSSTSGVGSVVTTKWGGFIMPLSINEWSFIKILSDSINDPNKNTWTNTTHQSETGVEIVDDERFIKFLQAKKGFQNLKCFAAIPHVSLSVANFISHKDHPLYKEQQQKGRTLNEDMFYIPAIDFPKWFISSQSELKHIKEWYDLWKGEEFTRDGKDCRGHNDGKEEYFAPPRDPHGVTHVKHYKSQLNDPYVYKMLTPVPLVLICPNGHISDIPWYKFFCAKLDGQKVDDKNGFDLFNYPCNNHCNGKDHELKWIVSRNQSESWGTLRCIHCKKTVPLTGIMNIQPFCIGEKPWEPEQHYAWRSSHETCGHASNRTIMQVAMVTSNGIYYALTQSSLYVPIAWTSQNKVKLQGDAASLLNTFNKLYARKVENNPSLTKEEFINSINLSPSYADEIYGLTVTDEECEAIKNEFLGIVNEVDVVKTYRLEEFNVFVNNDKTPTQDKKFEFNDIDLSRLSDKVRNKFLKIKQVPMLAVTSTQLGFSRVKMPLPIIEHGQVVYPSDKVRPIYSGNINNVRVLPANQIYGEGLFFAFDNEKVNSWSENHNLEQYYAIRLDSSNMYEFLSQEMDMYGRAKFYLLHTFSHLIMKELEFICGYPTASLSERLYYSDEMCGVLIYTADGAEGSMGGLVWQGQPDLIEKIILSALQRATDCSSDPMCWENSDGLNKAACFSCAMVSETSCEHGNTGLDRRALVDPVFGFFKDLI